MEQTNLWILRIFGIFGPVLISSCSKITSSRNVYKDEIILIVLLAYSENSFASLIRAFPDSTSGCTLFFKVPPIPSMEPFPWCCSLQNQLTLIDASDIDSMKNTYHERKKLQFISAEHDCALLSQSEWLFAEMIQMLFFDGQMFQMLQ